PKPEKKLFDDNLNNKSGKAILYGETAAEKASKWYPMKGDIGIPADHNLTAYEAIKLYGPTYAQVVAPMNFHNEWYEWVYYLLTPWKNWYFEHNGSPFVGLGWGDVENFASLKTAFFGKSHKEQQGDSFLSRAASAIDKDQKALIAQGQENKHVHLFLFTHFTSISYKPSEGYFKMPEKQNAAITNDPSSLNALTFLPIYSSPGFSLCINHDEAGWNEVNDGAAEMNLPWFYENCIAYTGVEGKDGSVKPAMNPLKAITAHFCGHSHRAGVYSLKQTDRYVKIQKMTDEYIGAIEEFEEKAALPFIKISDCCDPMKLPTPVANIGGTATKFVVASSGGIIGKQNFCGELMGWTFLKPSALVYNQDDTSVTKIEATPKDLSKGDPFKPRLCVSLDYLHYDFDEKRCIVPITFEKVLVHKPALGAKPAKVETNVTLHPLVAALDCVDTVKIGFFDGTKWLELGSAAASEFKDGKLSTEQNANNRGVNSGNNKAKCGKMSMSNAELLYALPLPEEAQKRMEKGTTKQAESNDDDAPISDTSAAKPDAKADKNIAFCGVVKFKPDVTGYGGSLSGIFDTSDDWVFPLQAKLVGGHSEDEYREYEIRRPKTAAGEIPNWKWLTRMDKVKYPSSKDIINSSYTPKKD
ncbi:MAG: hypothetical protein LBG61_00570, partial [Burkholderiales bacterium]|nr:hypothetical protein [Burkholderiales bacterium]